MDIITVSYNVKSANQERFRQFIDDVRRRLRVKERPFVMLDAVRLPLQENVPRRWLDLELRDGDDNVVTLRIRADNLYLTGFRGGNGKWFELQPDNGGQPLIQGSSPLAFNGGYAGSDGIGTIEDQVDHSTMANIAVSYNVSSPDQQRFRQFIDDVRSRLRVQERPFVMQHAARLPLQEDVPRRWLDLELRDGHDNVVTLRIRADNLYLTGFRGGNGKWFAY